MSLRIAIAASKGGTGKTTTTWNLGFGLALAGARVLLVDCDPQDNLRFIAGTDHVRGTVASAVEHGTFSANHIRESMWLLPGGGRRLWQATVSSDGLGNLTAPLRHAFAAKNDEYDFVLFDCPPELGRMTSAAISLSDYLLIPCVSTWLGLRSIEQMIEFIDTHTRDARIDSERTGIMMTFYTARRSGRWNCLLPPFLPPLRLDSLLSFFPRPLPDFFPPPDSLFTVAHARLSASFSDTPRFL
jgi:chromosome partitioning protein